MYVYECVQNNPQTFFPMHAQNMEKQSKVIY